MLLCFVSILITVNSLALKLRTVDRNWGKCRSVCFITVLTDSVDLYNHGQVGSPLLSALSGYSRSTSPSFE